jgi:P-type E1-E2 ATPase
MGIRIVMLMGDNEKTAKQIANKAGITEYYANLLPQDKVLRIEEIVKERRQEQQHHHKSKKRNTVVMVGDGINAAPALAKADLDIAMGKTGTDVAVETADIVLMTEDLKKIPYLIRASRQSILAIQETFFETLSVDGIGFILAATGHLNSLMAAFIHIVSEFVFMINSARLVIDDDRSINPMVVRNTANS